MSLFGIDSLNWMLVFLRTSGFLAVFPLLSANNIPLRVRTAIGVLLASMIAPLLPPVSIAGLSFGTALGWMITEVSVGLLLGFVARMVFYAIDFAGGVMAVHIGLSFAPNPNPFVNMQSDVPGLILYFLAAMLFFCLDLHHWLLVAFQRAYVVLPVGGASLRESSLVNLVTQSSGIFLVGVQIAAPIMAVAFLVSLVFSILARAVPQMNVFSESFPVRIVAGLVVFGFSLHLMAQHLLNYLRRLPEDLMRAAQLLGAA
ncbi:MAG TPA: flagellar biosynthetic protein FliR [Candidatus Paceibacterota bacterium]|nr:flagellar biosynthetic protein FliR [Verrucomicrobiota bacterium]HRY47448.1 flagellar biosynthetic protein FliR [Candidatus Paceibacterota bacterium]HSA01858.1 flagellar biosynthetic protein FliR [Candidatus Paceibacterota bacterium]